MADQLNRLDSDGLLYLWNLIKAAFVAKETGKGLTKNELTDALLEKLNNIAAGAQVNVLEGIKVAGVDQSVSNKKSNVPAMVGATSGTAGTAGVVPAPGAGDHIKFLAGDGTWQIPSNNNTTYTLVQDQSDGHILTFTGSDGTTITITIPDNNTTYGNASTNAAGLMSASDKHKLDGIAEGATANAGTVTGVKVNGTIKNPTGGIVDIGTFLTEHQDVSEKAPLASPIFTGTPKAPTAAAGTNTTQIATTAFVTAAIAAAIAGVTQISFSVVNSLPSTGSVGVIYLVPNSGSGTNTKDEYIWLADLNRFEKIGTTEVDLSNYWSKSELPAITNEEIAAICI